MQIKSSYESKTAASEVVEALVRLDDDVFGPDATGGEDAMTYAAIDSDEYWLFKPDANPGGGAGVPFLGQDEDRMWSVAAVPFHARAAPIAAPTATATAAVAAAATAAAAAAAAANPASDGSNTVGPRLFAFWDEEDDEAGPAAAAAAAAPPAGMAAEAAGSGDEAATVDRGNARKRGRDPDDTFNSEAGDR